MLSSKAENNKDLLPPVFGLRSHAGTYLSTHPDGTATLVPSRTLLNASAHAPDRPTVIRTYEGRPVTVVIQGGKYVLEPVPLDAPGRCALRARKVPREGDVETAVGEDVGLFAIAELNGGVGVSDQCGSMEGLFTASTHVQKRVICQVFQIYEFHHVRSVVVSHKGTQSRLFSVAPGAKIRPENKPEPLEKRLEGIDGGHIDIKKQKAEEGVVIGVAFP
ncbi:hypothetical protein HK104_001986, partial [Borealophlyctis nickersoniae]